MEKYDEIVLAWRNQKIKNAAELEAVLSGYVIQFVYHSGKIENPKIPTMIVGSICVFCVMRMMRQLAEKRKAYAQ